MNHLLRPQAPITEQAWSLIDDEARRHLTPALAARRLVDFTGPVGWDQSSVDLGRTASIAGAAGQGVEARQRRVLPLVEVKAPFVVSREELRDAERGALDLDFSSLAQAARGLARLENAAVFHGWEEAGIVGIASASPHSTPPLGDDMSAYPSHVASAVEILRRESVGGPYGLALGLNAYTRIVETTGLGGYPLFEHLHNILDGPIVWAPGVEGAVVVSLRGGDYIFRSGQDISIGYEDHDAAQVRLYLEQSFTFRVIAPEAGVALGRP